jgi:hypothetical protein
MWLKGGNTMSFRSLLRGVAGSAAVAAALTLHAPVAFGDSISPTSFSAVLGLGDTAHVTKTVTISAGGPTSALVDIMFVFDTTGSMGGAIAGAQSTATTVLNSLNTTYGGNLFSGAGFYNDPGAGITQNLSGTIANTQTAINGYFASGGGDYPELGYDGVGGAAATASWRPGSNRFIVALGDAGFKTGAFDEASTQTALTAANVHLIGVDFCASSGTCSLNPTFDSSITGLGGTVFASSTSSDDIAAAIIAGVSSGVANYTHVTVGDLGAGAPQISLAVTCLTADTGTCVGSDAVGTYDRSVDRTFTFDVAFTRTALGDTTFDSHALVDGGIVADERDTFGAAPVPEPATLLLVAGGLLGLGFRSRRRLH